MKIKQMFGNEIIRYLVVGGVSVGLDFVVYTLLIVTKILDPILAKRVSFIVGGIWAFFANKLFTFRKSGVKLSEPLLFGFIYFCGFFLNVIVHDIIFKSFKVKTLAFISATFVSILWNYIGQKWVVFRKNKVKINEQSVHHHTLL